MSGKISRDLAEQGSLTRSLRRIGETLDDDLDDETTSL
jgi:hypothetical protein